MRPAPTSSSTVNSTASRTSWSPTRAATASSTLFERANGQTVLAKPYMETINWTKGIDQKTGLPLDYDPNEGHPGLFGRAEHDARRTPPRSCARRSEGGNNYWSASYSPKTKLLYIPSRPTCDRSHADAGPAQERRGPMLGGRFTACARTESEIVVADPFTGEIKNRVRSPYPNFSAALTTAGGLVFTGLGDGTFIAYDDTTLEQLWKINVGIGFNAPPMTFEAGGRQYVAILAGLGRTAKMTIVNTPELREMRNQTMLFVFAL